MTAPVKQPLPPGLIARAVQGLRYVVTGATDAWMGPNQPLAPMADKPEQQTRGRAFDYRPGINLDSTPKTPEGGASFDTLRGLADSFDIMRLCIETRKDQIGALEWSFKLKDDDKAKDSRVDALQAFFQTPDRVHNFETWVRMLIEDLLVIDAPCVYPRLTKGGQPFAFEVVDGATIKRVVDGYGRTPRAPDPAYQQILKGIPAVDYTIDELIYRPRNLRSYRLYGFSPVEQVVLTVNIALRRQTNQLQYYTEGNIPSALIAAPLDWTPDMIAQFQDWWDDSIQNAPKRNAKFIPGGTTFTDTKAALFGPTDKDVNEWLARVICFAFSISPTQLVQMNNRATSDSQKEQAEDEGLKPTKRWVKQVIDEMVARYFGWTDIEFCWNTEKEIDPLKAAQIAQIYVEAGVVTPDEVRADLGKEPLTDEQKAEIAPPAPEPTASAAPIDDAPDAKEPTVKVDVHMPEIKLGDTLVEVGQTVVKLEQADGKVTEVRTDARS